MAMAPTAVESAVAFVVALQSSRSLLADDRRVKFRRIAALAGPDESDGGV